MAEKKQTLAEKEAAERTKAAEEAEKARVEAEENPVEAPSQDAATEASTVKAATAPAAGTADPGRVIPPSVEAAKPPHRSASDALSEAEHAVLTEQAARRQTEAQMIAESEENLNYGLIATEPPVIESDYTVEVAGGTHTAVVLVDSFSVIDDDEVHSSFVKGDKVKVPENAYNRGIALGALRPAE